jgi:putative ABC transport system substrate-binding protein
MKRRDFIALVGTVLWAVAAPAQQPGKMWRIGYLTTQNYPNELSESFLGGLRTLGYVEGKNLIVEGRAAEGKNERLPALATALIGSGIDIIVTEGTPATKAAMQSTPTVPIVFGTAQDPVEKGIVASLARPGGNVTGNALIADDAKPLQILKEAAPGVSRIAFIYDPATRPGAYGEAALRALKENARTLGMTVQPISLRSADETDQAFAALPAETDGLLIENSALNLLLREQICQFALARRLPAVGTLRNFAHAGCFLSYGEDNKDLYRRAASYVDKILKGAKPSDLPVNQATTFTLLVNLKTAKALGLEVPPSLLAGAAEVIE